MLCSFVALIRTPSMIHSVVHAPEDIRVLWSFNGTGGVNNALTDVALALSALLLAASKARIERPRRVDSLILGSTFASVMVLFGLEHFFYTRYTPGVPSWSFVTFWIPWRLFWGYLTGGCASGWRQHDPGKEKAKRGSCCARANDLAGGSADVCIQDGGPRGQLLRVNQYNQ